MTEAKQEAKTGICLVIEDSVFDQEKLRRILTRSFNNIHVEVVGTISEARNMLSKHPVSLILLDNNLPDGKGANYATELNNIPHLAAVPIIMVSDWPSPFMFDKAQAAGITHVVNKSDFGARHIHAAFAEKRRSARPYPRQGDNHAHPA